MSTEHVKEEAEAARAALGTLASKGRSRRKELLDKREGLQKERDNVVAGARLAMQAIDDDDTVLEEEFDQLDGALSGSVDASNAEAAQPANTASMTVPPAPVEPTPVAPTPPVPPEATPVAQPTVVQPEPFIPLRDDEGTDRLAGNWPHWTFVSWVAALLGGLFGAWVARKTYADLDSDVLFEIFWYILMIGTFACLFGWVAAVVEDRLVRHPRHRQH